LAREVRLGLWNLTCIPSGSILHWATSPGSVSAFMFMVSLSAPSVSASNLYDESDYYVDIQEAIGNL
jgi:hypothetical protein